MSTQSPTLSSMGND